MQIKRFPHEFLARWGRDGKLQGYHIIPVDMACDEAGVPLTKENGENLLESFGVATTLDKSGLDLSQLLGAGLQTALIAADRYHEERDHALAEKADAVRAQQAAEQQVAELEAQVKELAAQIAALRDQLDAAVQGGAPLPAMPEESATHT